jgi:hypothetical protein
MAPHRPGSGQLPLTSAILSQEGQLTTICQLLPGQRTRPNNRAIEQRVWHSPRPPTMPPPLRPAPSDTSQEIAVNPRTLHVALGLKSLL